MNGPGRCALSILMDTRSSHRRLLAWQEAMNLVETIYRDTACLPADERFGLTAQIRRAAISVPSNIAEGAARHSPKELQQFVSIACGSISELETQLELAVRLGHLKADAPSIALSCRVGYLVRALRSSLKRPGY
jgi:four helix bundle protein